MFLHLLQRASSAGLLLVHNFSFPWATETSYLSRSPCSERSIFSFHCMSVSHMLFAWQLWDMALPDLQEAGHSWPAASAICGNFPGVPACEYQQLLLCGALDPSCGWCCFPHSLGNSFHCPWFSQMKVILLDRKLFGHMENMKVQADLNEVCCILKRLCNSNF